MCHGALDRHDSTPLNRIDLGAQVARPINPSIISYSVEPELSEFDLGGT